MNRLVAGDRDAGFTLIEVLVSLLIITVVMVPLTAYFVGAIRVTHSQGDRQAAARVALDATERARGLSIPAKLLGRAQCGICPDPVDTDVAAHLTGTTRLDAEVSGVAASLPVPGSSTPDVVTLDGVSYRRYHYLGRCWQLATGGACDTDLTKPVKLYRLVVVVTWKARDCPASACTYITTALFPGGRPDPVFAG